MERNYTPKFVGGIEFLLVIGGIGGMDSGAKERMTATRKHATPANRISALLMRLSRK